MLLFLAIPLLAQQPPPAEAAAGSLAAREATAQKRAAEWEALAKGLESKIARMLPCDPRVKSSIEEVSKASQARLAALSDYLQAANDEAKADVERARKAIADAESSVKEIDTERIEAIQQRAAIDGQLADLKDSARRRPALEEASAKLTSIRAMTEARVARLQQEQARRTALSATLANLAATFEARQKSIDAELAALTDETARWVDYYTTKQARAATECSITNQARPRRRRQ